MPSYRMLIINPGSVTTKIAVYDNENPIFCESISHSTTELSILNTLTDKINFRMKLILNTLKIKAIDLNSIDAVIGRGGLLKPLEGGTYKVNSLMVKDLYEGTYGKHAANLGGIIANDIANNLNIEAYIVDPTTIDEMSDIARLSGIPEIERKSIFHALNQKAAARKYASEKGVKYEEINLIVAHLGSGISVGAHKKGRVVDVNNALDGEGPFSPERAGSLPSGGLIELCYSGKYSKDELLKIIVSKAGFVGYFNTNDAREVWKMVLEGDKKAKLIFSAMAYQVAKEIGRCAAVLSGQIDAIILTGGLAYNENFTAFIKDRVKFISDVVIYPGENEMLALAEGGLRVLSGEEEAKEYI